MSVLGLVQGAAGRHGAPGAGARRADGAHRALPRAKGGGGGGRGLECHPALSRLNVCQHLAESTIITVICV